VDTNTAVVKLKEALAELVAAIRDSTGTRPARARIEAAVTAAQRLLGSETVGPPGRPSGSAGLTGPKKIAEE